MSSHRHGRPAGRGRIALAISLSCWTLCCCATDVARAAPAKDSKTQRVVSHGLDWVANTQARQGQWVASEGRYPTAMTALAASSLLCEGSTAMQGKYSSNIRRAIEYLVYQSRSNGLIGDPTKDDRYTYGHGYSMLFLSQVLGEEEDEARRKELVKVLTKAVEFCGRAQTEDGGWGYVSAKDGNSFDEGSTTITQVQGLRGCRNAGIPVPKEVIDKAIKYIQKCTGEDGGVQYSSKGGGERPAISAAAVACLFNAGDYDSKYVPKLLGYCEKHIHVGESRGDENLVGHWHYAHYYYSQVMYREGGKQWDAYREAMIAKLLAEVTDDGKLAHWSQGYIGPIYTTSVNLTILQLENGTLPIYQR